MKESLAQEKSNVIDITRQIILRKAAEALTKGATLVLHPDTLSLIECPCNINIQLNSYMPKDAAWVVDFKKLMNDAWLVDGKSADIEYDYFKQF